MEEKVKVPWWEQAWVIILACIFIPPGGIALIWIGKNENWKKANKIIITVFLSIYSLFWFVSIIGGNSSNKQVDPVQTTGTTSEQQVTTDQAAADKAEADKAAAAQSGIKETEFIAAVNDFANNFNAQDSGVSFIPNDIRVAGTVATVTLYLGDLMSWSVSDETSKKEFINVIGQTVNTMAVANSYPGETVGASVIICSPSGMELGEYTIWGNVKLK
ncbi:hypothetical protein FXB42_06690 [Acetobacterium wieringae]|uniref:Uncharacterized protein n=1 Tax=Acetobacterium wieringae TaxID=52694 RepID=A0A5D0WQD9_9FIRM|nr:hypothetical protein [Acetobacterium wieringae]TYC86369.1 hypothetical protein FXB42_06690 [Acetobacterium wieringae]